MEDYKELMKELFLRYYAPEGEDYALKYMSTTYVHNMFRGIIPSQPISEHDVFELLKELGFKTELETLYEEVCIVEENKSLGIQAEYDKIEIGKVFKWLVFEK